MTLGLLTDYYYYGPLDDAEDRFLRSIHSTFTPHGQEYQLKLRNNSVLRSYDLLQLLMLHDDGERSQL